MDKNQCCGTCIWANGGVCGLGAGEITTLFVCEDYEPEDDNK